MSLEIFTGKVSDLVPANPAGTDPKSQGDDHLRGIKETIIGQSVNCQLGQSSTPANNFTLSAAADNGTMKLARGNAGATTQDIMTVDAAGKVAFPQMPQILTVSQSSVALPGGMIVKAGTSGTSGAGNVVVTFTTAFPTVCLAFLCTAKSGNTTIVTVPQNTTGTTVYTFTANTGATTSVDFDWIAIGY